MTDKTTILLFGAIGGLIAGTIAVAAVTSGTEYYVKKRVPELMAQNIDAELKRLGISKDLFGVVANTAGALV